MQTKPDFIMSLSDTSAGPSQVGGKGVSLARMSAAGLPVPSGFYITTAAYCQFVDEHTLQEKILASVFVATPDQPATLEAASSQIRQLFAQCAMPAELADAIRRAYAELGEGDIPVAVRSSATAEDLLGASFAGQQETYLNIQGVDAVLEAVKKCWASLWTARAIAYRAKQGIVPDSVALAVVVQELVHADAAGVMFTANPISGKRDEIMITATWGLGEAIVSGAVTPDTLTMEKLTGRMIRRETAEKQVMTVWTESGTSEAPVPDSQKKKEVLSDTQATELARLGVDIEKIYGLPMDIEWALAGERLAILQARPITALPAEEVEQPLEWHLSSPHAVGVRVSLTEFVPDAVPPLFATLAVPIANLFTSKLMDVVMGSHGEAGYYFEVVNGYVYSCLDTRQILPYLVFGIGATSKILKYGRERRQEVQNNSRNITNKWRQTDLAALPAVELVSGVRELFGLTADYYTVAQSGPIPASTMSEALFSYFYNVLVKRKSDLPATTFLLGLENLALQAETSLFDLAQWVQGQGGLADYLRQNPAQAIRDALKADTVPPPLAGEFADRFGAYLTNFGHAIYDLDFSKPVAVDDPLPVLETLKMYLASQGHNPHVRLQAQAEKRQQAEQAISARLDPLRRKWFKRLLKSAQERAPDRENAIADLGLPYPQIQRLLRELGKRLTASGEISQPEDIYWLEAGEVDAMATLLDQNEPLISYTDSVTARKAYGRRAHRATPPTGVPEKHWIVRLMGHKKPSGNILKGIGASAGQVTAPACVLRKVEDFAQMRPGDVLVAVTTTPAWTPLFAMASAIVTDIGGPLSHSSIVAREYGIPAVMATGVSTRRIRTGQVIMVDGNAGTVILKE